MSLAKQARFLFLKCSSSSSSSSVSLPIVRPFVCPFCSGLSMEQLLARCSLLLIRPITIASVFHPSSFVTWPLYGIERRSLFFLSLSSFSFLNSKGKKERKKRKREKGNVIEGKGIKNEKEADCKESRQLAFLYA